MTEDNNLPKTNISPDNKKVVSIFIVVGLMVLVMGLVVIYYLWPKNQQKTKTLVSTTIASPITEIPPASPKEIIIPNQKKAEMTTRLTITPSKNTAQVSETINLQIILETPDQIIDGTEFVLSFKPEQVTIGEILKGEYFKLYPVKNIDQEKGTIKVVALNDSKEVLNKEAIVATVPATFREQGEISFKFLQDKCHVAGYGGQELLKEAVSLTITVK